MKEITINPIPDAFGGALQVSESPEFTIIGIPYDLKSTHRKGSAGGPDAIRAVSTSRSINSYTESGTDLKEDTILVDRGGYSG
ncbi:arginase family protein [candidate division KSB1 bacterium]